MRIVYSFNKSGFEAEYWTREIAAASTTAVNFIPFNHGDYLDPSDYIRAQLLDNLYYQNSLGLFKMYKALEETLRKSKADALLVDNCPPYHPDYLRGLTIYKILRIADGPMSSYDRDFPYLHAYDHILYHTPAYSRDMGTAEKLRYCGATRIDFWPLASFDALCDRSKTANNIFSGRRNIDVVFVGALHVNKMPLLAKMKKAFRSRMMLRGVANFKKNIYFNLMFGAPGWVHPLRFKHYVGVYQRAKIGINIHNRGEYTLGGYRMFDLPANGVMQISDGGVHLDSFFVRGQEIIGYSSHADLIEKVAYYLEDDEERERIALGGFLRVQRDYKISIALQRAATLIAAGVIEKAATR